MGKTDCAEILRAKSPNRVSLGNAHLLDSIFEQIKIHASEICAPGQQTMKLFIECGLKDGSVDWACIYY